MSPAVKAIPDGMHTVQPHLTVRGTAEAMAFYKRAFGAKELMCMPGPDGKGVMHAEIQIGDSVIFLNDEFPGCQSPQSLGGSCVTLSLYVEDADAVFQQAVAAGAQVVMPLMDMFWGDRYGQVTDPFGHRWAVAKEDVTPEECAKRAVAAFANMGKEQCHS